MILNPRLFEINTRVFVKRFEKITGKSQLGNIPEDYFDYLSGCGIDYLWLLGVWQTNSDSVYKYCFEESLVNSYRHALKDFTPEDVIGSPFAIDIYAVNKKLGNLKDITAIREALHKRNMGLILDFVPNHFSVESRLIQSNPDIFLQGDEETYGRDSYTYFKCGTSDRIFAHGRDPFFPAWQDTVQVNFFSDSAVDYLISTLESLVNYCDGVRCDMAMLALNNVFYNTWGYTINKLGYKKPASEFWQRAIERVKQQNKNFIFIAEAYWDMEWQLQQLGFDFTYDKRLTDRLHSASVASIHDHLKAEKEFQQKSVRFLENHDEERALRLFGREKSKSAAVIMCTIPGMKLFYEGQFEGKRCKLPVQLGREPNELPQKDIQSFYLKLLEIIKSPVFSEGNWTIVNPVPSWGNNFSYQNIFSWKWELNSEKRLIVSNYSAAPSQCRIRLELDNYPKEFRLFDLLNDIEYTRSVREVTDIGLYIDLKPYQSHIFTY